jgi:uncharacterized membrane protein YphA (DoxX/SURF4 family)
MTPIALRILRVLVAALFLYAGVVKIGMSERFAITVAQFGFLPVEWVGVFAFALPWVETLTGVLMLLPWTSRWGAALASLLLATFIAALAWAWQQGLGVDCNCFGEDSSLAKPQDILHAIVRDAFLLVATLLLAARRRY